MVKVSDISDDVLEAVKSALGGMDVTREQVVNDLLEMPEVSRAVKKILGVKNREEAMPQWARDAKVDLAAWDEAQSHVLKIRKLRLEEARALQKLREEFAEKEKRVIEDYAKRRPVLTGTSKSIAEASLLTWNEVDPMSRARYLVESKGKSEDEKSLLKNNVLSAARGARLRHRDDS